MSINNLTTRFAVEGTEDVVSSLAALRQSMLDQGFATKSNIAELKSYTDNIYAMRRAQTAVRTTYRVYNAEIIEGARILRDIGAIGRNVVSMWQAYTLAQTRVADAARDLRMAQGDVVIIQDALNRATRSGDLEQQMELTLRLSRAQNQATEAGKQLAAAQQQNIIGYAGMAMQSMDIIARIPMMSMHIQVLTSMIAAKSGALAADTLAMGINSTAMLAQTEVATVDTGVRAVNTAAIWGQVLALKAYLALIPGWGWAVLAGAAIIGGGAYLATRGGGGGTTTIDYHPTVYGGMAGLKEDRDEFVDSLRRRGIAP